VHGNAAILIAKDNTAEIEQIPFISTRCIHIAENLALNKLRNADYKETVGDDTDAALLLEIAYSTQKKGGCKTPKRCPLFK